MNKLKAVIVFFVVSSLLTFHARADIEIGVAPDAYNNAWKTATERDIEAMRRVMYWESGENACTEETLTAICETILNRAISGKYAGSIYDICNETDQFYCEPAPHEQDDAIYKVIDDVRTNGRTVLPSYRYIFFATQMQSIAKNHLWIGKRKANGKPDKGTNYAHGMYFGEAKEW